MKNSYVMIHYYRYLFVKKKVFSYSELHFSEVTSYKIHTLTSKMANEEKTWISSKMGLLIILMRSMMVTVMEFTMPMMKNYLYRIPTIKMNQRLRSCATSCATIQNWIPKDQQAKFSWMTWKKLNGRIRKIEQLHPKRLVQILYKKSALSYVW